MKSACVGVLSIILHNEVLFIDSPSKHN